MRVVSGIQPTGNLHLGNLLGAILRWVKMQDEAECLFFLADLHALTVDVDPAQLRSNVREMAAALIASGIDPARSVLFAQSAVPAHAELAWLLQCIARMGWLNRMTQFKEKSGKNREGASVGLYTYPVLQAADILMANAELVPVEGRRPLLARLGIGAAPAAAKPEPADLVMQFAQAAEIRAAWARYGL